MKFVDASAKQAQISDRRDETDAVHAIKREIIKSLVLALQLDAEDSSELPNLTAQAGIDFYTEVRRFETNLIKRALILSNGNQRAAAKLLGLNATTLNGKIKLYALNGPEP